jgi:hypothetical protein
MTVNDVGFTEAQMLDHALGKRVPENGTQGMMPNGDHQAAPPVHTPDQDGNASLYNASNGFGNHVPTNGMHQKAISNSESNSYFPPDVANTNGVLQVQTSDP